MIAHCPSLMSFDIFVDINQPAIETAGYRFIAIAAFLKDAF